MLQNIRAFVSHNEDKLCTRKNIVTYLFANAFLSFWMRFLIEQKIEYSAYHYAYFYIMLILIPFAIFLMFNFERKKASCFLFIGISILNISAIFSSMGLDYIFDRNCQSYKYFKLYDIFSCVSIIIIILLVAKYSVEKGKSSLLCPISGCCAIIIDIIALIIIQNIFLPSSNVSIKIILPFFVSFSLLFGILFVLKWYYMIRYLNNGGS